MNPIEDKAISWTASSREWSKIPHSFWTKFGICSHSDHLLEGEDG
jgi:hypothetical protein